SPKVSRIRLPSTTPARFTPSARKVASFTVIHQGTASYTHKKYMTPERWRQVQEVIGRALELPHEEQAAFVRSKFGSAMELRTQVESLLSAEGEGLLNSGGSAMDAFLAEVTTADLPSQIAIGEGTRVGAYVVRQKIGEGGMGVVYRAIDTQ